MALRSVLSNADVRWNPFEAIVEHPALVGSLLVACAPGSASGGGAPWCTLPPCKKIFVTSFSISRLAIMVHGCQNRTPARSRGKTLPLSRSILETWRGSSGHRFRSRPGAVQRLRAARHREEAAGGAAAIGGGRARCQSRRRCVRRLDRVSTQLITGGEPPRARASHRPVAADARPAGVGNVRVFRERATRRRAFRARETWSHARPGKTTSRWRSARSPVSSSSPRCPSGRTSRAPSRRSTGWTLE